MERKTIGYQTVKDAVQIVADSDPVNPFDDDSYMAHDCRYNFDEEEKESRGYYVPDGYRYRAFIIEPKDTGNEQKYARNNGASKQTAYEHETLILQNRIDAIKEEYKGRDIYGVTIEVNAGGEAPAYADKAEDSEDENSPWFGAPDISESCWGFDYETARTEGTEEIAMQAVNVLEKNGWTVIGKPDRQAEYKANRRESMKWRAKMFDWSDKQTLHSGLIRRGNRFKKPTFANFGEWYAHVSGQK